MPMEDLWKVGVAAAVFVMIVCFSLLIYFGVTTVTPYRITSAYSRTKCTAVNVTFHGYSECTCGSDSEGDPCSSVFPCQEITVTFASSQAFETHKSRLFQYYTAGYKTETCSMWTCDESPVINEWRVSEFVASYGNTDGKSTYTCFYNPVNPDEVIVEKTSRTSVIISMVLPAFVFLCCVIFLLVLYRRHSPDGYFGMFRRSGNNYVA